MIFDTPMYHCVINIYCYFSCGLYEATPPMTSTHTCNDKPTGSETTPSNCIYPSLNHCDEPVSSILHNLTTKTWSKAAERSLMDHNVKTIGDLSKLTAVKASALRSLRPPSNLVAIKEALRKFEKSWIKRGRDKYTEKKLLQNPSAMVEVCTYFFSISNYRISSYCFRP